MGEFSRQANTKRAKHQISGDIARRQSESNSPAQPSNFLSPKELYRLTILEVIIRPLYSLTNRAKVEGEITEDSHIWTDYLFDVVPIKKIQTSWRLACQKQTSSYAPNYFNVLNAFREIEEKEKQTQAEQARQIVKNNPVLGCKDIKNHATAAGEVKYFSSHAGDDVLVPCSYCRFEEFEKMRKKEAAMYGEFQPKTIVGSIIKTVDAPAEDILPLNEIKNIQIEYHNLLSELVPEEEVRERLKVIWDEGGNCFKHTHTAAITFAPKALQRKIDDYKKAIAKRLEEDADGKMHAMPAGM